MSIQVDFTALVPDNFREIMTLYWMFDEHLTRPQAFRLYGGIDFDNLCSRIEGKYCEFTYDRHPSDGLDMWTCFEVLDDNFVIPVNILSDAKVVEV